MPRKDRIELIRKLEDKRGNRVICYITGDRQPGLETRIGTDVFPFFYEVLSLIGHQPKLDILLYSTGGATMAAWGLVNLVREFCDRFAVLIPFKAHSCATLIALGANEIVMSRTGQLSPVDPTVTSPFNPTLPNQAPGVPPQFLPVSVEDVVAFMELVRKEANIQGEDNVAELVKVLASDVRPLALGSVYRAKEQIKMLAKKLLSFHMGSSEQDKIDGIVTALTRELYSHDYPISRREAKEILGLKVAECADDLERCISAVFRVYADEMALFRNYSQQVELGDKTVRVVTFDRAYIETTDASYVFRTKREIKKVRITREQLPFDVFQERPIEEGWIGLE